MNRKRLLSGIIASVMLGLSVCSTPSMLDASATNPIVQTSFTPDPAPVVFGDELWVYTGRDRDGSNDFYYMTGWQCFSTTDMQNWTDHGCFLEDDAFSWCNENDAWASQCIERNGKYYFYFTTTNKSGGGRAIGVAVADNPAGPFKDVLGKPLCGPNWDYIDPTVIIDDDGQAWLMFGNPKCYYVKLKEDMVTLDGEIKSFDMNAQSFGNGKNGSAYGEGPWIYKHDNLYYLVYAGFYGSDGGESMCYSYGPSVTGPWTFGGQITKESNCFTIHGGIIDYKDHSYMFYHMNGIPGGSTFNRSAAVEEFTFNPDGSIPKIEMGKDGPKQIELLNPYERVEAETMSWSSGIKTEPIEAGTQAIGYIEDGDYVKVSGVDFGEAGASEFYASVASNGSGGKIELHLDSEKGPMVGTVTVPVTGDWQAWETVSGAVSGATGTHDLYLRFSGGESYLFNVDWWQFRSANAAPFLLGDVDSDGAITAADLALAKQIILNKSNDSFMIKAADVNQSGTVTMEDVVWMAKFLTGQVTEYPEKAEPEQPEKQSGNTDEPYTPSNYQYDSAVQFHEFPGNYTQQVSNGGKVIEEKYTGINGAKTMYTYLPPGYDESKKYNVFYLMHGGGENEKTCFFDSSTQFANIFDHMIQAGELDPLIVVTPTFNGSPDGSGDIWNEIRQTIVPYIEGKYSTYAEKNTSLENLQKTRYHRAYGGFSMGGGSTWNTLINDIDIFAYFMPLSGHCWGGVSAITSAIDKAGFKPDEYYIFACTGSEDIAHGNMVPQINEMKSDTKHFIYTSDFSKGNFYFLDAPGKTHWWGYVRHYVYDALPSFFHEHQ